MDRQAATPGTSLDDLARGKHRAAGSSDSATLPADNQKAAPASGGSPALLAFAARTGRQRLLQARRRCAAHGPDLAAYVRTRYEKCVTPSDSTTRVHSRSNA